MSNEIKEFYDLDELTTLLSRNLNIDIENKKELSEVIFKLISKNHLTPYLEYSEPPRDCRRLNILREYDNEKTNLHS